MEEIWKDIEGYEGIYQVSSFGRVRSLDRIDCGGYHRQERILKQHKTRSGYIFVTLCKNGKRKPHTIHRLVAIAFVPGYSNNLEVNHKDENKSNNHHDNLEWITRKENLHHHNLQRTIVGKIKERCCKPVEQYDRNRKLIATYESGAEASRQTGFTKTHISACCKGKLKTYKGFIWKFKK